MAMFLRNKYTAVILAKAVVSVHEEGRCAVLWMSIWQKFQSKGVVQFD